MIGAVGGLTFTHRMVKQLNQISNPKPKRSRRRRERYNHPQKQVLAARILDLIERSGGMTSSQIKKQLFLWAYPDGQFDVKRHRGWWSDPLYGGLHSSWGPGLLKTFCNKEGRKWVRNKLDHEGHPWKVIMRSRGPYTWTSSSWKANPLQGGSIILTYSQLQGVP